MCVDYGDKALLNLLLASLKDVSKPAPISM